MGGSCCVQQHQNQNSYFQNCKHYTLLVQQRSKRKYQGVSQHQKTIVKIKMLRKDQSQQFEKKEKESDLSEELNRSIRKIQAKIDGEKIINHGIFQDQIKNILLEQHHLGKKFVIVEQPECDKKVNLSEIFILVIKGIMDAEATMRKKFVSTSPEKAIAIQAKGDSQQNNKLAVIVYWARLDHKSIEKWIGEAQEN